MKISERGLLWLVIGGTIGLTMVAAIFELSVGERYRGLGIDLGSAAGALLIFIFMVGIASVISSFDSDAKEYRRLLRYAGGAAVAGPPALLIMLSLGGLAAIIAMVVIVVLYIAAWIFEKWIGL
jgi:hypothetical protein